MKMKKIQPKLELISCIKCSYLKINHRLDWDTLTIWDLHLCTLGDFSPINIRREHVCNWLSGEQLKFWR